MGNNLGISHSNNIQFLAILCGNFANMGFTFAYVGFIGSFIKLVRSNARAACTRSFFFLERLSSLRKGFIE